MTDSSGLTRRAFLRHAALAVPAVAALPRLAPVAEPPPPGKAASPQKVIVLGAGLAGLAAALELVRRGHDVTVLEAQMRPGGRLYTLRSPFSDGLYADAGAVDFTENFRLMRRYLDEFKLQAVSAPPPAKPLATALYFHGKRLVVSRDQPEPDWPFALTEEERKLGFRRLIPKFFGPVVQELGDPTDPAWRVEPFEKYDRLTLAQYLREQGASDGAIELMSSIVGVGYGWSTVTALHRLLSDFALFLRGNPPLLYVEGGFDRLPHAMARSLAERVQYGAPVMKVVQDGGKVRAVVRRLGGEEALEADRLICTAPCPVMRRMQFTPELPAKKRQVIRDIEYTPVLRTFAQVRRRIWDEQGFAGNSITDLPIELVSEHPLYRTGKEGPRGILEAHVRGAGAPRLAAMDEAARMKLVVENMDKVHPGFGTVYEGGASYDWAADPWAGGGYAWWKPGQMTDWLPELARAEGRVHFAGEHTSLLGRTMEGALESGNRAAREVEEAAAG